MVGGVVLQRGATPSGAGAQIEHARGQSAEQIPPRRPELARMEGFSHDETVSYLKSSRTPSGTVRE